MKRAVTAMMILFTAVIVFFSFFGERLYYITKPDAVVYRVQRMWMGEDGSRKLMIPKKCVHDGEYVYTVTRTGGFSLIINTVFKKEVDIIDCADDDDYVIVESGLNLGDMLVAESSEELQDGDRVNCVEDGGE